MNELFGYMLSLALVHGAASTSPDACATRGKTDTRAKPPITAMAAPAARCGKACTETTPAARTDVAAVDSAHRCR